MSEIKTKPQLVKLPNAKKLRRARVFALKLSRGEVPQRPCSPYGGLVTDCDTIKIEGRAMYECLLAFEQRR